MVPGPNVDIVEKNPYHWKDLATNSFDVVISGQAFEHTEFFWITMSEMVRVLKKDGLLCIIAPSEWGEHRYPVDCYRFLADGMVALARWTGINPLHAHSRCKFSPTNGLYRNLRKADIRDNHSTSDALLVAQKPYDGETQYVDLNTYFCVPPEQNSLRQGFILKKEVKRSPFSRFVIRVCKFILCRLHY
jgi:SAM-dependent methyltransferase